MKNINIYQKITASFFGILLLFWIGLFVTHRTNGDLNYAYSFLFGLVPLIGGIAGMENAKIWGGLRSALGKALFFVSFGLLLWGLGETIWSYYNFVEHVPAPYPSLADIGFAPSIFFWVLGIAYLSKATGALFALKKFHFAKLLVILVPMILLLPSYYIQISLARGGTLVPDNETVLKTVLDIVYPFGDFLALTLAGVVSVLSYKYFGGIYRQAVSFILAGTALMYVGDSIFSYTTTKGTYYNANWGDLILTTGLFFITFGILAFASKPPGRQNNEVSPSE